MCSLFCRHPGSIEHLFAGGPAEPKPSDEDLQKLGLKKEEFDHFRSPQAVDAFKRRLEETTAGYEKLQTNADFGGKMREVLQPYEATIQSMGVEPTTAVQTLLAADHALRYGPEAQKVQMFQRLAQSYGVSLEGLTQEQPEVDPQYSALQSEIERLRAEQNQFVTGMQQQTQQQLNGEIEAFAKDHEHFEAVREDMAMLMEVGKAQDLEDAYNKALRLNDELAAQINAQQHEEAEKVRREKAAQAAQAAKQAAVSVTGAPVAGNAAPSPHDRRAVLAAAMDAR